MSVPMNTSNRLFLPARDTRMLLIKWVVALIVPLAVFNFFWQGDALINNVILGFINPASAPVTKGELVEAGEFYSQLFPAPPGGGGLPGGGGPEPSRARAGWGGYPDFSHGAT